MNKLFKYSLIVFGTLLFLTTCKKYPENTLWFKNPGKVLARDYQGKAWALEFYSVNEADSLNQDFLKAYRDEGVYILYGQKGKYEYLCASVLHGYLEFRESKKSVTFRNTIFGFNPNSSQYTAQRNIFLDPDLNWKIKKLTKSSFWITATFNNATYEMHFK